MLYGNAPTDLGLVGENINCDEMMFYLYMPIKKAGNFIGATDERVSKYHPLVQRVFDDMYIRTGNEQEWIDSYVYITAKTLYVSLGCMGQRLGWHSDGFMTDDINYIWYTDVPTKFWVPESKVLLVQNHAVSLEQMEFFHKDNNDILTFPNRHLLRMDQSVIHKTDDTSSFEGVRTFVKISVSKHIYALRGNSVNPHIDLSVEYKQRSVERNCPATY